VEAKAVENTVRSYLLGQSPTSHSIGAGLAIDEFSGLPQPDELYQFDTGTIAIEYECGAPVISVQKYWWLLNRTDFLDEKGKLALVVLGVNPCAQPVDQVERQMKLAAQLEESFPGKFSFFFVGANEIDQDTLSDTLSKAYSAIKN
jgi:hypothetical protein